MKRHERISGASIVGVHLRRWISTNAAHDHAADANLKETTVFLHPCGNGNELQHVDHMALPPMRWLPEQGARPSRGARPLSSARATDPAPRLEAQRGAVGRRGTPSHRGRQVHGTATVV